MKRIILFIFLWSAMIAFEQNDWKTLKGDDYSIQYPDDWTLKQTNVMGAKFILFSQLSGPDDKFRDNINLIVQNLPDSRITLDKLVEISIQQIKELITDAKIIESKRIQGKTSDYHKIIYTGKHGVFFLKYMQYVWVIDNKAYILTFTAEEKSFDKFFETAKRIMDSFKIESHKE